VATHITGTSFALSSQTLSADDEKPSIIIDLYGNVGDRIHFGYSERSTPFVFLSLLCVEKTDAPPT
jgi:hypothetical protein